MAAIAFDTLKYARKLMAVGVPEKQAEAQAEIMAEAFLINTDTLVTKDYLDARLNALLAKIGGKFTLLYWMMTVVMASTAIPALHKLFV